MDGLSSLHPFWGPLPAFLYSWISALLLNPTSGAATCLGCASYTVYPILNALGYCLEESTEQALLKITAILYVGRYYMNIHHIQHQIGNLVNYLFHRINDRSEFVQRRVDFGCEQHDDYNKTRRYCHHCRMWCLPTLLWSDIMNSTQNSNVLSLIWIRLGWKYAVLEWRIQRIYDGYWCHRHGVLFGPLVLLRMARL